MLMCVILLWPSKIICSLILMQNMFNVWVVDDKLIQKCVFGRSGLNISVFEKYFISYSYILFIKYYALRSFYIKLLCFSKFWVFQIFDRSSVIFDQSQKISDFSSLASAWLDWYSIDARPIETEKFSIFKYLTNLFFFASFMFRIHMHCIVFCIHLAVLQSYLSLFSHITCIHFTKLGTQLDLKIDWLIFESFVHSSICYFYVNCRKLFS